LRISGDLNFIDNITPMKLKSTYFLSALALITLCLTLLTSMDKKEGDYDWLKQRLDTTKDYTLEVFEALPDNDYDYRPSDEVRSFKEQAYHIVYSIDYFNRIFKGDSQTAWNPGDESSKSKAELIKWANEMSDCLLYTSDDADE